MPLAKRNPAKDNCCKSNGKDEWNSSRTFYFVFLVYYVLYVSWIITLKDSNYQSCRQQHNFTFTDQKTILFYTRQQTFMREPKHARTPQPDRQGLLMNISVLTQGARKTTELGAKLMHPNLRTWIVRWLCSWIAQKLALCPPLLILSCLDSVCSFSVQMCDFMAYMKYLDRDLGKC